MHISEINITGFGIFANFTMSKISPGLVVICGDNEAGKSTLLNFVRTMFFGPSPKRSDKKWPPVRGGTHGGSLIVETREAERLTINRRLTGRQTDLQLFDKLGRNIDASKLDDLLSGATRELFTNIYGFSLYELHEIEMLESEQVKAALYGASLGSSISALPRAQQKIDKRIDELFKTRGTDPLLNKKLAELSDLKETIEQVSDSVKAYEDLQIQITELDRQIRKEEVQLETKDEELANLRLLLKHYPDWLVLQSTRAELLQIPKEVRAMSDDIAQAFEKNMSLVNVYEEKLLEAQGTYDKSAVEMESLRPNESILANQQEITRLFRVQQQASLSLDNADTLNRELVGLADKMSAHIQILGAGWDSARIRKIRALEIDTSVILDYQSKFSDLESRQKSSESATEQTKAQLAERIQILEQKRKELANIVLDETQYDKRIEKSIRAGLDKFVSCASRLIPKRQEEATLRATVEQSCKQMLESLQATTLPSWLSFMTNVVAGATPCLSDVESTKTIKAEVVANHKEVMSKASHDRVSTDKQVAACEAELAKLLVDEQDLGVQQGGLPSPDEIPSAELIQDIREQLIRLEQAAGTRAECRQDMDTQQANYVTQKKDLGMDIEDQILRSIDLVSLRSATAAHKDNCKNLEKQISEGKTTQRILDQAKESLQTNYDRVQLKLTELPPEVTDSMEPDERLRELERLKERLSRLKDVDLRLEYTRQRLDDMKVSRSKLMESVQAKNQRQAQIAVAAALLLGIGLATVLGIYVNWPVGAIALALVVVGAIVIVRSARKGTDTLSAVGEIDEQINTLERTYSEDQKSRKEIHEEVVAAASALNTDPSVSLEKVDEYVGEVRAYKRASEERTQLLSETAGLLEAITEKDRLLNETQEALALLQAELSAELEQLQTHFAQAQVPLGEDPSKDIQNIEKLQASLELLQASKARDIQASNNFSSVVRLVCQKLCIDEALDQVQLIAAANRWIQEAEVLRKNVQEREIICDRSQQLSIRLAEKRRELDDLKTRLSECDKHCRDQQAEWARWLQELEIPGSCSYDGVLRFADELAAVTPTLERLIVIVEELGLLLADISEYKAMVQEVPALREACGQDDTRLMEGPIRTFLDSCDVQEELSKKQALLLKEVEGATNAKEDFEKSLRNAEEEVGRVLDGRQRISNEWKGWLIAQELDSSMDPSSADSLLKKVQDAASTDSQIETKQATLRTCEEFVRKFNDDVRRLVDILDRQEPANKDFSGESMRIYKELQEENQKKAKFESAAEVAAAQKAAVDKAREELSQTQQEMDRQLTEFGCASTDDFRSRYESYKRVEELVRNERNSEETLFKLLGVQDVQGLEDKYSKFDADEAAGTVQGLERSVNSLKEKINGIADGDASGDPGLRHQLSSLITQRENLKKSEDLRKLRLNEQRLIAEAGNLANEWIRLMLASCLLDKARERFEKEGQPHVVDLASQYFEHITGGSYTRVIASPEGRSGKIEVLSRNNERLSVDVLSTGTQEQLYLCLRFAFVNHRATTCEPLPIIMDDVLVNFDANRAMAAAQTICKLAESHQVLFFTCHPATVKLLLDGKSDTPMVKIEAGSLIAV
jgi:uncharacterized protein YhaN